MPTPSQAAAAVPSRRYRPLDYGRVVASAAPRAIAATPRIPALPFPDLPDTPNASGGAVTSAMFWHAAFVRDLAMAAAGEAIAAKLYTRGDRATDMFIHGAMAAARKELRESFANWIDACGGLVVPANAEGSLS